jgi:hypothetical protein
MAAAVRLLERCTGFEEDGALAEATAGRTVVMRPRALARPDRHVLRLAGWEDGVPLRVCPFIGCGGAAGGCRTDRPAPPCLLDDTIQYEIDPLYVTVSDVLLLMT